MPDQIYKVKDPSGNVREIKGPAGATDDQVIEQAKKLFGDAPADRASQIPGAGVSADRNIGKPDEPVGIIDRLKGAGEAGLAIATSIPATVAGNVSGVVHALVSPQRGTAAGAQQGEERARDVSRALTYEPRTESGKSQLATVGEALNASKLAGLGPAEGVAAATAAGPVLKAAGTVAASGAEQAAGLVKAGAAKVGSVLKKAEPPMVGMGSAETADAALRTERAGQLPVPIKLSKGQETRTFEQQQFERETAKNAKEGEPLRRLFADQNEKVLQNFDHWVDETGMQSAGLRGTGQSVVDAVVAKAKKAKGEINAAYDNARKSGDMNEPIPTQKITDYLEAKRPEAINAPLLSSVEAKLAQLTKDTPGQITINDLEEVRKMVGRLADKDATAGHFGKEVKGLIDSMTDGMGGQEYQKARALRAQYATEFEDAAAVNKLITTKPGTRDRSVAYEDVFKHSVLNGSLDDVKNIRRTLQTAGDKGTQAWKDLQGQTVQHIKDEITSNVSTDINGNKVVSAAKLDRLVNELDRDGKLDYLFGKKGAQQIRDVNATAKDLFTSPPGSVNTSNTASILLGALDKVSSALSGVPVVGSSLNFASKQLKSRALQQQVSAAVNNPPPVQAAAPTSRLSTISAQPEVDLLKKLGPGVAGVGPALLNVQQR